MPMPGPGPGLTDQIPVSYELIADLEKVPNSRSFIATNETPVHNMKRMMMDYINGLESRLALPDVPGTMSGSKGDVMTALKYTPAGFPVLTVPIPSQGWGKAEWETLYKLYMKAHYSKYPWTEAPCCCHTDWPARSGNRRSRIPCAV